MKPGYCFEVTCLACGGALQHANGVTRHGTESIAIAACTSCGADWELSAHLRRLR